MRAVVVTEYGGPEALELIEVPVPEPGPGQVRVKVEARGVNPVDLFVCSGGMVRIGMAAARAQTGIGADFTGTIDAVGEGVDVVNVFDRVVGLSPNFDRDLGPYADFLVVGVEELIKVTTPLTAVQLGAVPLPALTAYQALDLLDLPAGGTLLVTGAAGSVGSAAVQLGALRGLRVVATARVDDEAEVRALGADIFIPDTADLALSVREMIPGGVDAAIDPAALAKAAHDAVRDDGQFVVLAVTGDPGTGRGITNQVIYGHHDAEQLAGVIRLAETGEYQIRICETYPLERSAEAHKRLGAGGVRGRLVLTGR